MHTVLYRYMHTLSHNLHRAVGCPKDEALQTGGIEQINGDCPYLLSTGTWRFYAHDHLGSTRGVYNSDKTPYAGLEHTPYGELYASSGSISDITRRYTGHDWDAAAGLYYAPYRYYSPGLARWITRDPLGMVDGPNVYGYVRGMPINLVDVRGTIPAVATLVLAAIAVVLILYFGYSFIKNGKECFDALEQFRSEVAELKAQGEFEVCEDIYDSAENEKKRYEEAAAIGALPGYQKVMDECPDFISAAIGP